MLTQTSRRQQRPAAECQLFGLYQNHNSVLYRVSPPVGPCMPYLARGLVRNSTAGPRGSGFPRAQKPNEEGGLLMSLLVN